MGYSPSKKQLDLREFLSSPAKKRTGGKTFGFRNYPAAKSQFAEDGKEGQSPLDAAPSRTAPPKCG